MKGIKNILSKKLKRFVNLIEPSLPNMNRPDYSSEVGLLDLTLNNEELLDEMLE